MGLLGDALAWLTDSAHYSGTDGIPHRFLEHVHVSLLSTILAGLVALPVGLYVGHRRRWEFVAISIGNLGRALPSFGILALVFPFANEYLPGRIGYAATVITLFMLAIPPILTNTYVAIKEVDPDIVEAARGMGMSEKDVLLRIEIPVGASLIVSGFRTAAVQVVATATLAALVGWGAFGRYIIDGFATGQDDKLLAGAILVALLAIAVEVLLGFAERAVATGRAPKGLGRIKPAYEHAGQVGRSDAGGL